MELLASPDVRGAAIALVSLIIGAVIAEFRAGRDDGRRRRRDRDDRRRVIRQRAIDQTRAFLVAEYEAMRRHVMDGVNVVRPRRGDFPGLELNVIGARDALEAHRHLVREIYQTAAGGRDRGLIEEIDRVHEWTGLALSTQELRLADDDELATAGISGFEATRDPMDDP